MSRVPTKSNVEDFPSRQQAEVAARIIGGHVAKPAPPSPKLCDLICNAESFVAYMPATVSPMSLKTCVQKGGLHTSNCQVARPLSLQLFGHTTIVPSNPYTARVALVCQCCVANFLRMTQLSM